MLGVLLSEKGKYILDLLTKYLKYAKKKAYEKPKLIHLHSSQVVDDISLDRKQSQLLGWLLRYDWLSNGGSFSENEWKVGLPRQIEDIPDDPREYVAQTVAKTFDPTMPIDYSARRKWSLKKRESDSQAYFDFIADAKLRKQIVLDWHEALTAFDAKAWKSTIVLCGGVLEGILIERIKAQEEKARSVFEDVVGRKPRRDIESWRLVELVEISSEMDLIDRSSFYLSHALRHFRNLIHPARHVSEQIELSQETAAVALNTIRMIVHEFN